eukprot:gene900-9811_t
MTEEFHLKIKEYEEAFHCIDKDRDGDIATPELFTIMRILGFDPTLEELKSLTEQVDQNGKINYNAYLMLMEKYENEKRKEKKLTETFKLLDKDQGGTLQEGDLQLIMKEIGEEITKEEAKQMIDYIDIDGDGQVTLQEFLEIIGKI